MAAAWSHRRCLAENWDNGSVRPIERELDKVLRKFSCANTASILAGTPSVSS